MSWPSDVVEGNVIHAADVNAAYLAARSWGGDVDGGGHSLTNTAISATTFTCSGNAGVGTASPSRQFHIYGSGQASATLADSGNTGGTIYVQDSGTLASNGGAVLFGASQGYFGGLKSVLRDGAPNTMGDLIFLLRKAVADTSLSEIMRITMEGRLGLGVSSPTYLLQLGSDSAAKPSTSTWTVASDGRVKRNVQTMTDDSLAKIRALRFVEYDYNGLGGMPDGQHGMGVVAQEAQAVMPEMVRPFTAKLHPSDASTTDILGTDWHAALIHCARSIQQLATRLDALGG